MFRFHRNYWWSGIEAFQPKTYQNGAQLGMLWCVLVPRAWDIINPWSDLVEYLFLCLKTNCICRSCGGGRFWGYQWQARGSHVSLGNFFMSLNLRDGISFVFLVGGWVVLRLDIGSGGTLGLTKSQYLSKWSCHVCVRFISGCFSRYREMAPSAVLSMGGFQALICSIWISHHCRLLCLASAA